MQARGCLGPLTIQASGPNSRHSLADASAACLGPAPTPLPAPGPATSQLPSLPAGVTDGARLLSGPAQSCPLIPSHEGSFSSCGCTWAHLLLPIQRPGLFSGTRWVFSKHHPGARDGWAWVPALLCHLPSVCDWRLDLHAHRPTQGTVLGPTWASAQGRGAVPRRAVTMHVAQRCTAPMRVPDAIFLAILEFNPGGSSLLYVQVGMEPRRAAPCWDPPTPKPVFQTAHPQLVGSRAPPHAGGCGSAGSAQLAPGAGSVWQREGKAWPNYHSLSAILLS